MAKRSPEEPGPSAGARRRRRRKVERGPGEAAAAPKGPAMAAAPPRSPQEFSANWKALQELLKQKANSSNETLSTCQTSTKKKHLLPAGSGREVPALNGKVGKAKPANQTDSGSAKDAPPLAEPKSKRGATDKALNGSKSDGKGCKEKKKNSNVLKEKDDIKHKRRKAEEHAEQQPKEPEIWFDDVDPKDIEAAIGPEAAKIARRNLELETKSKESVEKVLVKETASEGLTRAVAMDCEMVGVGPKGEESIVARVSIVNQFGKCVYDKYVKPTEEVTDYRTAVSGIRPENINTGEDFKTVQKEVADILKGRILVGHALRNDLKMNTPELLETTALLPQFLIISCCTKYSPSHLPTEVLPLPNAVAKGTDLFTKLKSRERSRMMKNQLSSLDIITRDRYSHPAIPALQVLFLDHPKKKIRDTQKYKPFKQRVKCARPSLKLLCERLLNIQVQTAEHCSIQDAQAAMRLYTLEKKTWEAAVKNKSNNKNSKS